MVGTPPPWAALLRGTDSLPIRIFASQADVLGNDVIE